MTGTVAGLYRYPIKSFQGVAVDELTIGPRGVDGDRRYALIDASNDKIASAKMDKQLLDATVAETADGGVTFTLPDGRTFHPDDDGLDEVLSEWVGRSVTLTAADERDDPLDYDDRSRSYLMTFDPEHDDA